MKKFFVMLLAALLVASCGAAAEETAPAAEETVEETAENAEKPFIDFDIKMDKVPEGYTYEVEENGGSLYATFMKKDDPEALIVYVSVAYADEFEGYTLKGELTEEQIANVDSILTQCYNDPAVTISETEYGTKLICVSENDAQTDYADLVTVWNGYLIDISLQKKTQITDEDMELAGQIASDMWIVEE